jgi:Ni/Fe-hydrogenase subunit HybB-like protein
MPENNATDYPSWRRPRPEDPRLAEQYEHAREEHLNVDARPIDEMTLLAIRPTTRATWRFWIVWLILGGGVLTLGITWTVQMFNGLGITGLTRPVMWAVYIANFVYFIGIGHAGTFISAAFRALRISWRGPISRPAELLTVFGLSTAGLFPLIHLGRSWKFYWLIPYPNQRLIWPSFHSPLVWDLIAITTYLSCSVLFAYLSLIPDLAMARDRATIPWRRRFFEVTSLGWRGTERQWSLHETAMNVFTYAIIPVMFSVHTVVSWDFAMALQPGWHSTVFGPYFVVGALYSGVAAVIIILATIRKFMHLEYFIRAEHFNGMGLFLLLLSFTWAYFYFNDYLVPWYGQTPADKSIFALLERGAGGAPLWYLMLFSNIVVPWAVLWSRRLRTSIPAILIVSVFVNVGMYLERIMIVAITLGVNELPFDWGVYTLQLPETLITIGAFSLVAFLFFLYSRFFPIIPVWEVAEGQALEDTRRVGRAVVTTRSQSE